MVFDQQLDNYLMAEGSKEWFARKHTIISNEECIEYNSQESPL